MPRDLASSLSREIFRLTSIVTEEVSLVDRPANKQPFLIIKRSDTMPREIVKWQNGLFSTSGVLKMQQTQRDELFKFSADALEGLSKLIELCKTAEIDEAAGYPQEVADGLRDLASSVQEHVTKMTGENSGDQDGDGKGADDADKTDAKADAVTKAADLHKQLLMEKTDAISACLKRIEAGMDPEDLSKEIGKMQDIMWSMRDTAQVAGVNKVDSSAAQDVEKSSHWMTTMQTLFDSLKDAVDKVKPPKDQQNVGAGNQPDTETVGSFADAFGKLEDQLKTVKEATQKVDQLEAVIKRQAQEIESMKSGVDVPSSGDPVTEVNKGDDDAGWPLDMAASEN